MQVDLPRTVILTCFDLQRGTTLEDRTVGSLEPPGSFGRRHRGPVPRGGNQSEDGELGDPVPDGEDGQVGTLRGLLEEIWAWATWELALALVAFVCVGYVMVSNLYSVTLIDFSNVLIFR